MNCIQLDSVLNTSNKKVYIRAAIKNASNRTLKNTNPRVQRWLSV